MAISRRVGSAVVCRQTILSFTASADESVSKARRAELRSAPKQLLTQPTRPAPTNWCGVHLLATGKTIHNCDVYGPRSDGRPHFLQSPNSTWLVTSRNNTTSYLAHAFWMCRACRTAQLHFHFNL